MCALQLLSEVPRTQRRPVPVLDGEAPDYRDQIVQHLRLQSMQAHASLLAIPSKLPDRLQWFTDLPGTVIALQKADPLVRQAAIDQIHGLLAEIGREAVRLGGERAAASRALAETLNAALEGTGAEALRESDIFLLDGQPVLVAWGMRPVTAAQPIPDLISQRQVAVRTILGPKQATPGLIGPAVTQDPPWPLRLLAAAAVLLLLGGLMAWLAPRMVPIAIAALRLPPVPSCDQASAPDASLLDLQTEEAQLRGAIAQLERSLSGTILQCRLDAPTPPSPPRTSPTPHPDIDQRLQREGAKSAQIQVTLAWDNRTDLDLHVVCPDGVEINFNHRFACGGNLDVDMNSHDDHVSDSPVENVVWPNGAPPGTYRVAVDNYSARHGSGSGSAIPFTVRITVDGQQREIHGTAGNQPLHVMTEFTVP